MQYVCNEHVFILLSLCSWFIQTYDYRIFLLGEQLYVYRSKLQS